MYSDEVSDFLRTELQPACKFRQFCDAKDATDKGLHKGDKFHWNVYSDVANQGTSLVETSTMPETKYTISQGTVTITEYGNSVPYTGKLDDLSLHPVKEVIHKALKNDAKKAFDVASHAQFNATKLIVQPTAGTATTVVLYTNGTATQTNSVALKKGNVKAIVDQMKERNIDPYSGDDYMSVSHPSTYRTFKNDLESIHQYVETGLQMIFYGEIGRYESCRFVEQTNIAKENTGNANGSWAFFFGGDTVAEAIAIPEEIRGKIPTDFGRSRGIAWYALLGFGIVHPGSGTAGDPDGPEQGRILKYASAA